MNSNMQSFLSELGKAPLRSKVTVVVSVLAVAGILALAGMIATRPHFVTLHSGLDDVERVAVEKALAEGRIRFRASQPPGPYSVYVDESQMDEAQIAVALAEALRRSPSGIATDSTGTASIFLSSGERQQAMLKREWEETEHLLEQLEFIREATVKTSMPDNSPMSHKQQPITVSVTLQVRGGNALSSAEAQTVAKLVRYRFGVPPENVLISDQFGHTLHDASSEHKDGQDMQGLVENAARYDEEIARKVNDSLALAFGPRKAHVTVTSDWDFDQSLVVAETVDPETVQISSEKHQSKTPTGSQSTVGGPAGVASNLADPNADPSQAPVTAPSEAVETEERAQYETGRSKTQTVRTAPRVARLSVSLMIDESLAAKRDEIVEIVKAGVGFDTRRNDVIGVSTTTFAAEEVSLDEQGNPVPGSAAPPAEESNRTMELLMTRGVEIVAALGFVLVLLLSLKGTKGGAAAGAAGGEGGAERAGFDEPDPALVARMQIEELVKSDPRRVGAILSSWANDGGKVKA